MTFVSDNHVNNNLKEILRLDDCEQTPKHCVETKHWTQWRSEVRTLENHKQGDDGPNYRHRQSDAGYLNQIEEEAVIYSKDRTTAMQSKKEATLSTIIGLTTMHGVCHGISMLQAVCSESKALEILLKNQFCKQSF